MYLFSAGPAPKPKGQESIAQGWYLFSVISQSSSPFVLRVRSLVVAGKRAERRGRARYEGREEPAGELGARWRGQVYTIHKLHRVTGVAEVKVGTFIRLRAGGIRRPRGSV
jgi:hypothetical protein